MQECYICKLLFAPKNLYITGEICLCTGCVSRLMIEMDKLKMLTLEEKKMSYTQLVRHIIIKYPELLWMLREAKKKW
jgi:Arc/MetJ family transcription regulator